MKMMNLILSVFAVVTLASGAMAQDGKTKIGPAGCGLGHMVFGGKDMQILVATTNGSSYSQIFGITSGTSDCEQGGRGMAMLNYIQNNKQSLEKDIARGQGESLGALAQITGCADEASFNNELKGHYSEIFPQADRSAAQITESIKNTINGSTSLKTTCTPLS